MSVMFVARTVEYEGSRSQKNVIGSRGSMKIECHWHHFILDIKV